MTAEQALNLTKQSVYDAIGSAACKGQTHVVITVSSRAISLAELQEKGYTVKQILSSSLVRLEISW